MGTLPEPLELVLDEDGQPVVPLHAGLAEDYGGPLRLRERGVFANFVSSLDGVVSIPSLTQSSSLIADRSQSDRFVMGLLRACADAVVVGSGTLMGSPKSLWTAERVYPEAAEELSELRERLGLPPRPQLFVLTASGSIDAGHPALEAGAVVITTDAGGQRLRDRLPGPSELVVIEGSEAVDVRAALDVVKERGHRRVLSEAGPTLFASFLAAGAVDEVFLTLSPVIAGRTEAEPRLGLVEGRLFLPEARISGRLTGLRRHDAHLFLRYELEPRTAADPSG